MVSNPKITEIRLNQLILDPAFNARVNGNRASHVRQLIESNPDTWPPLLVTPDGTGAYVVIDGNHRVAAAEALGLESLRCEIVNDAGLPEGFDRNCPHGLPLSTRDRKEFAWWLRESDSTLSLREIGRRCGLHHTTVKATLEDRDEPTPSKKTKHNATPAAERLVSLVVRVIDDSVDPDSVDIRQLTSEIQTAIQAYDDDSQSDVAAILHDWGTAMQSAAQSFMSD